MVLKKNNLEEPGGEKVADISQRVERWQSWIVVDLGERVDSFNFAQVRSYFESLVHPGSMVAINVKQTKFLSLAMYQYIAQFADLLKQDRGQLAVLGATEKMKHQMGLLASVKNILIVKRREDLPVAAATGGLPRHGETPGF